MIQKIDMYGVVCDKCDGLLEDTYTGCIAWVDEQSAAEKAEENNWVAIGDKWYYPDCYEYNEELDEWIAKGGE